MIKKDKPMSAEEAQNIVERFEEARALLEQKKLEEQVLKAQEERLALEEAEKLEFEIFQLQDEGRSLERGWEKVKATGYYKELKKALSAAPKEEALEWLNVLKDHAAKGGTVRHRMRLGCGTEILAELYPAE